MMHCLVFWKQRDALVPQAISVQRSLGDETLSALVFLKQILASFYSWISKSFFAWILAPFFAWISNSFFAWILASVFAWILASFFAWMESKLLLIELSATL